MTLTVYRLNGTPGTTADLGNTGATAISLNGGTAVLSSAAADEGATGLEITSVAGLVAFAEFAVADPSVPGPDGTGEWTLVDEAVWTPTVTPNADETIHMFRSKETGVMLRLIYSTTGTLYLQGAAGSTAKTLATAQPLNTKFYLNGYIKPDTTATGKINLALLNASRVLVGTRVIDSAYNLTTGAFDHFRVGVLTVLNASTKQKIDTIRISTGHTGATPPAFLGAYTPPSASPPVIGPVTSQQVTTGVSATYTAAASDPSGTVANSGGYQWRVVSSPGAAPTLTNPSNNQVTVGASSTPGTIVLGVIATSSSGQVSAERTVNHYVSAVTGVEVGPNRVVANPGGWVGGGTATDVLDGTTDSGEWIQSPAGPKGASITLGGPPVASTQAYAKVDLTLYKADGVTLADVGASGAVTLQYFSGTTAVSDVQNVIVTRTTTTTTLTLTTAQNAALDAAGRWDPRLVMTATAD